MTIDLLWTPGTPENFAGGIEEMSKKTVYASNRMMKLKDRLMDAAMKGGFTGNIALKVLPTVSQFQKIEFEWLKPRPIIPGTVWKISLKVTPGIAEAQFKSFGKAVSPDIFLPAINFPYGKVKFIR